MKCYYFVVICYIALISSVLSKRLYSRDNMVCQINKNEIDPIVPCIENPSQTFINGQVLSMEELGQKMNNKTCLALQPWSEIQRFMNQCTEIKTEQEYAQWVVRSLCPDLDEEKKEISSKIAEKCINFENTQCLCENNLYKYEDLYQCFRQNDTSVSLTSCKDKGWIIDSSAIFNINYKFLPIGILALFATFFF
ncbi:hypothetical protein H8356DRAFT_1716895 [Neocallimastix lanati (nom. inval.)]|uniref:Extracellular membrane protein CFEM domain-containing protein n=1 Tax=Neocallimastix californiae TaxID=1754190 RepID=A0A1Y2AIF9_9FUNG|nr:hypothetical protein H8356DRAFT_1716895 [Neocallimastix sp. JGI-2020a]ORY22373.1 hypothetical protein LY90DRAFT_515582 [Neocallimastix californiae]|eukprot:ORY22373.1 hypothetical protein LY90DRAFT_515582 [Neocallimastix californiae]